MSAKDISTEHVRLMEHRAGGVHRRGPWKWQCATCRDKFYGKSELNTHLSVTGHESTHTLWMDYDTILSEEHKQLMYRKALAFVCYKEAQTFPPLEHANKTLCAALEESRNAIFRTEFMKKFPHSFTEFSKKYPSAISKKTPKRTDPYLKRHEMH